MCNILRVSLSRQQMLGFPLPLAECVVDTTQTYNGRIVHVRPCDLLVSDWNLSTTGGDNPPTELLLY